MTPIQDSEPLVVELRPHVGMQHITVVPHVAALGICLAAPGLAIGWPYGLVDAATGATVCALRSHAGYDGSMFVRLELNCCKKTAQGAGLVSAAHDRDAQGLVSAMKSKVEAWAAALEGKPALGPLAPVIDEYVSHLFHFGEKVAVTYPNGQPYASGTFAGIDMWGRATVRLPNGQELEFAPERFCIA